MRTNNLTKQQTGKLKRLERAREILAQGKLFQVAGAEEKFVVFSSAGNKLYLVDLAEETCTCPDFRKRKEWNGGWCKHRIAAWLSVNHPDDYQDWLPPWARGKEQPQAKAKKNGEGQGQGQGKLDKALAELPDAALERLIKLASAEQLDRDFRRKVEAEA